MQNLENLDVFEILITQKLLKCSKDPFVRSALKCMCLIGDQEVPVSPEVLCYIIEQGLLASLLSTRPRYKSA